MRTKRNIVLPFIFVVALSLSIGVLLLVAVWALVLLLSFGFNGNLFSSFLVLPLTIVLFLVFTLLSAYKQRFNFFKCSSWLRVSFISSLILSLFVLGLSIYFIYASITDTPPQFFPLDDQNATYSLVKESNGLYEISYDATSDKNAVTDCITNSSGNYDCTTEARKHIKVLVGESKAELEQYVGKKVILSGNFVYGHRQCTPTNCTNIGNSVVFNITSIR